MQFAKKMRFQRFIFFSIISIKKCGITFQIIMNYVIYFNNYAATVPKKVLQVEEFEYMAQHKKP